ncbi:biotin-independent malonate decarboxylase subunit beta [Saccharibacillus sp. CPCC 101409]|uniref:biotin-independent malonate decarboxylase subunit beta n=1 Tax=Saccharibacillus sp. CPCC 101409 TaxID=3058041 RepID=UPI00267159E1|nr:biotin-independent malonate decarboxylase subunit beta [Saccharibacillus sp. CPCC 101409]MDO3410405.1 biotin-independent malonate decarboxylase subunit beta [Saccharibacillus sp. CPCC 101409]
MTTDPEIQAARRSYIELSGRERARAVLDAGTFRELVGPFDRMESPHLPLQGIVPQSDDGVIVARGAIDGEPAIVISLESKFQGGGIGEVGGAKIAGALELTLRDRENGIPTRPVLLLETGGVRLQEGNYGLLAIAEIGAAIVALRPHVPVVSVISGMIGCYGGMSICAAGLSSRLIMTRQGRLQLNGSEVIEQEAGIAELDAADKPLIWSLTGGAQRVAAGFADVLAEDDIPEIAQAIRSAFEAGAPAENRSARVEFYRGLLAAVDPRARLTPEEFRELFRRASEGSPERNEQSPPERPESRQDRREQDEAPQSAQTARTRGRIWFERLSGREDSPAAGGVPSVLCADGELDGEAARFVSVVPNPANRFERAVRGEVGLDEGWAVAQVVREAVEDDKDSDRKRAIVAIVDVPSQAYGYREELMGIHLACAAAVDAYASARLAGHPVVALIVGNAISGAFLAHGMQASRLIAFEDDDVTVQVMSKPSAARITRRTIEQLNEAAEKVPGAAYDVRSFARLGALHELLPGIDAGSPGAEDLAAVTRSVKAAIEDARKGPRDLSSRLASEAAGAGRAASIEVRRRLADQWKG